MLPALLEIRNAIAVAHDDDGEASRAGVIVRSRGTARNHSRSQHRDKGRGQPRQLAYWDVTQTALQAESGGRVLKGEQAIGGRKLLQNQARGKRNAVELADPLQPPQVSLSPYQQFGSQRRAPLSRISVFRLAPKSGREATQITNTSFLQHIYRLTI